MAAEDNSNNEPNSNENDNTSTSNNDNNNNNNSSSNPAPLPLMQRLTILLNAGKLDAAAWFIRIYLVFLSIQYILLGGAIPSVEGCYKRCLICNAVIACIRLHQRIGNQFALSKEHFLRMSTEDSAHYLFFSIIFLMQPSKITLALMPITLMAVINAVKYGYKVMEVLNTNVGRSLLNSVAMKQQTLFRLVALTEIFLLPMLTLMVFLGRAQFLSPFLYYRYIKLRYSSQRNAYCRQVFYELRMSGDMYKNSPRTPGIFKKAIDASQNLCFRLAD